MRDAMTHEQIEQGVELVYDPDCPNVESARELIRIALATAGLPIQWKEWNRSAEETPASRGHFGSPTILVDGRDVAAVAGAAGVMPVANSCRLYHDVHGKISGVPSLERVMSALAGDTPAVDAS